MKDRPGVVEALQEAGLDVPRQGKNYVTARMTRRADSGGG